MVFFLALYGCGDKPIESEPNDTPVLQPETTTDDGCSEDSDCGTGMICEAQECTDGDRNNTQAEAVQLLWEAEEYETINPYGDIDYFSFSAAGGEYIRAYTVTDYEEGDTILTLRDPNGKIVTWSDDYPTNSAVNSFDSVLYAYLSEPGDFLLSVEDYNSSFSTGVAIASENYEYSILVEEWSRHVVDPDSLETPGYDMEITSTNSWNSVGLVIEEADDVDYVSINYTAESGKLLISGIINLDGSDLQSTVNLHNEAGEILSTKPNVGPNGVMHYPMMQTGQYFLTISDQLNQGGMDYWTFLFLLAVDENPYFQETEENGDFSFANDVELSETETSSGKPYGFGRATGNISTPEDEDWFVVEHKYEDGQATVCLNANLYGSTLIPTVEIYDNNFELVSSVVADPEGNPNVALENGVLPTGNYYIRIFSEQEDLVAGESNWYQFLTYSTTFEPTSYDCP